MRMLDLYCGHFGWAKTFAERGWECVGIDWTDQSKYIPEGCRFVQYDIMRLYWRQEIGFYLSLHGKMPSVYLGNFDFVCASSPCEEFSIHRMKHFHPSPPYPETGIKLFNHTRMLCEKSGVPYVMENVAGAEDFVGQSSHKCGPFHLWGPGTPPLMPKGITKGIKHAAGFKKGMTPEEKRLCRLNDSMLRSGSKSKIRKEHTAKAATIPPELASCVEQYARYLYDQRTVLKSGYMEVKS